MLVTIANLSSVGFLVFMWKKKNSFKKVPSIYKGKMYALQNSNGEGSEQCYMLLIFLLLTLATLIMQAK